MRYGLLRFAFLPLLLIACCASAQPLVVHVAGDDARTDQLRDLLAQSDALALADDQRTARLLVYWQADDLVVRDPTQPADAAPFDRGRAADAATAASRIRVAVGRRQAVDALLALDNPRSAVRLSARIVDDSAGGEAGVTQLRIRVADQPRSARNSLQLQVTVDRAAYLTIVVVDASGHVSVLLPNDLSEQARFLPGGRVNADTPILIPDAFGANLAGFHWDVAGPLGRDTVRVFAATTPRLAAQLRAYVGDLATVAVRGPQSGASAPATDFLRATDTESGDWAVVSIEYDVRS